MSLFNGKLQKVSTDMVTDSSGNKLSSLLAEKAKQTDVDASISNTLKQINVLTNNKVRLFAHRGASILAPENTLAAFELAGEMGFGGIETDTLVTSDGVWVMNHDLTVDAMTNGTGSVSSLTLAQIKALNIDAGFNVTLYPTLTIPTLEEYLSVCRQWGLVPLIEIKNNGVFSSDNYNTFVDTLRKYNFEERAIVISYNETILTEIRNRSKKIALQLLKDSIADINSDIAKLKAWGNCGVSVDCNTLTKDQVDTFHLNGIPVGTWTVDDYNVATSVLDLRVDFITTSLIPGVK